MKIKDKVAVVTGAASGIGNALCTYLAQNGCRAIAMVDINDEIETVAEHLNKEFGRELGIPFKGDTTDCNFRRSVFDAMKAKYGIASICVPAAGITRDSLSVKIAKDTGKAALYPIEKFRLVVEVNLIAPIYWAMEMIADIAEERKATGLKKWHPNEGLQGSIVLIGSISSQGNKGQLSYASAKSGLEGAASTLTKEAIFHGVRCCIIHPGFTDTPMVQAMGDEYISKHILPETQLGRLIRTDEIADAIGFMLSNPTVSGAVWADAGWHPSPT
ncbi:MAG: SDR family NAD(P)-dependent oxidoreductase [Candidatus Eutrophobiaceae bacterium]